MQAPFEKQTWNSASSCAAGAFFSSTLRTQKLKIQRAPARRGDFFQAPLEKQLEIPQAPARREHFFKHPWKKDQTPDFGLIAQDVEKIIPQLVKNKNILGAEETYKVVNYISIIPLLIESIKELNNKIEEIKHG